MKVTYYRGLDNVDWDEMKTTLRKDKFDNGRTVEQYQKSFENSYSTCIAYLDKMIIGTARTLSDGIGNAYIMDVWTLSEYRRKGIARKMIETLIEELPGQHVYLQTDSVSLEFYKKLGFKEQPYGVSIVVGEYLKS